MANKIQLFIYNLSAASPLAFVFAFVWYQQYKTKIIPFTFTIIGLVLILLLWLSFSYGKRRVAYISINANDISPNDGWIIAYIITYLVPFSSIVLKDFDLKIITVFALILILFLPFVNSAIPNPLLFLKGYHFYSVSAENGVSGYVLISKRAIRNSSHVKLVKRIFEYFILDLER